MGASAAVASQAAPLPPPPFAPPPHAASAASPPHPASTHAHLADMLAGVLLLREGSVADAAAALPGLHDLAKAYILALEALALAPASLAPNKTEWAGLSAAQAAALAKGKAGAAWNESGAAFREKVAHTTDPLWEEGVRLQAKFGGGVKEEGKKAMEPHDGAHAAAATAKDAAADAEFAAGLKQKLADFNVHFSDKMVEAPSKFRNFAALIMKHVSGVMAGAYGVDFNPW